MEVHVVRHTRPKIETGVCYGQSDIELADSFPAELSELERKLSFPYHQVYSSPLKRCRQLADKLSSGEVKTDPRLQEADFGAWELRCWDDIPQAALTHWMQDFVQIAPPQGESLQTLYWRVANFMDILPDKHLPDERLLLVTHGGVMRCIWAYVLEIPLKNVFRMNPNYGSINRFTIGSTPDFHQVRL